MCLHGTYYLVIDPKIMWIKPMRVKFIRWSGLSGIIGSILTLTMVFTATIISPWFRWDINALSEMGVGEVSLLFNIAMMVGGFSNLIFGFGIREYFGKELLFRYGTALIILGSLSFIFVGIFTISYPMLHGIVAFGTFVLPPTGFILIGYSSKENIMKKFSIITGIAALITILVLPIILLILPFKVGFAVPEIIEGLIVATWVIFMGIKLRKYPYKIPKD
jgi:hypothetical membrane protein